MSMSMSKAEKELKALTILAKQVTDKKTQDFILVIQFLLTSEREFPN